MPIDEVVRDLSSATNHIPTTPGSIGEMERVIAELEARLTPVERLEYYECVAQGELRFDALSTILRTR
jgi:hypothetical protein